MEAMLTQGDRPVFYHLEMFPNSVLNYCTYEKELFALIQVVKKWKNYLMEKETILHSGHQPSQYLQAQNQIAES
jgi:hypothetical protein